MNDQKKTKKQLIEELEGLRRSVAEMHGFAAEIKYLRADQEKFTKAFLHSSTPVAVTTLREGRFVDANSAFLQFSGYERNEIIGSTSMELGMVAEEQRTPLIDKINRGGRIENIEITVNTKTGGLKQGLLSAVPIHINREEYLLTTITDITGRIRAEEALRKSEEHYRTIIDFTSDWEYWLAPNGSLKYISPSCERMTGYRVQDFQRDPELIFRIVHPDDRTLFVKHVHDMEALTESTEHVRLDFRIISLSGEERWIGHICRPIYGQDGEYRGRRISNRDITKRIRTEEALRKSEEKLQSIFRMAPIGIAILNPDRTFVSINDCFTDMFGYEEKDLIGRNPEMIYAAEGDFLRVGEAIYGKASRPGITRTSSRMRRKDGTEIHVSINAAFLNQDNPSHGVIATVTDETDRERAEDALRESEELYRLLLQNANDAVFVHAFSKEGPGRFLDVNERACQMLGYTREELLSMGVSAIDVPQQTANIPEITRQILETGHAFFETEHKTKDGRLVSVEVSTRMLYIRDNPTILSIARDIAERRQADYLYRTLARHVQSAIFIVQDSRLRFVNPYVTVHTGYEEEELINRDAVFLIHPEDRETTRINAIAMIKGERDSPYEFRLVCKDGSIRWIMERSVPIRFEEKPAVLMNSMDITERKRAESERERLISDLGKALSEVKTLSGLLPICSSCKKVRDDTGYWNQIESYIRDRSDVQFSHGICPDCARILYPEYYERKSKKE